MDDIDRALLFELQKDADRSLIDLGEIVGLSASAVQRRISRLKADGEIEGIFAKLSRQRLGLPVVVVTMVRFERDNSSFTKGLIDELGVREEVQLLHSLAGQFDLVILSAVGDLDDYTGGVLAKLEADDNVSRIETHVSLGEYKSTHALPLP